MQVVKIEVLMPFHRGESRFLGHEIFDIESLSSFTSGGELKLLFLGIWIGKHEIRVLCSASWLTCVVEALSSYGPIKMKIYGGSFL